MTTQDVVEYFRTTVPAEWFVAAPTVEIDDDEVLVVGALAADRAVDAFREDTRDRRIELASEAERRFRRKVSWGVEHNGERTLFSTLAAPITTRLRFAERAVLDTLVDAGVARSRADALSWCVKLVGRHEGEWLEDLRSALTSVEKVRAEGPKLV